MKREGEIRITSSTYRRDNRLRVPKYLLKKVRSSKRLYQTIAVESSRRAERLILRCMLLGRYPYVVSREMKGPVCFVDVRSIVYA